MGGNANAVNENSNGSFDVGLWQVNSMNWKACSGGRAPCDVETNLKCAIDVYRWGGNTFKLEHVPRVRRLLSSPRACRRLACAQLHTHRGERGCMTDLACFRDAKRRLDNCHS